MVLFDCHYLRTNLMSSNALDLIFKKNMTNTDNIWCYGCFCKLWFLGEKGNIILTKKNMLSLTVDLYTRLFITEDWKNKYSI